jgi:hypothetical protein
MADSLLIQFENHQAELAIIGKLVLAYGELEFAIMDVVRAVMGGNTEKAVKAMYRLKSESTRLELADALVAGDIRNKKFGGYWHEAYCALKTCKTIRNQYAHGQFIGDNGLLRFGDMDEAANNKGKEFKIRMRPIHLSTLNSQLVYFEYAHHVLMWLADQIRLESGQPRLIGPKVPKPKKVAPPKFDSRGEERPPRLSEKGNQQPQ